MLTHMATRLASTHQGRVVCGARRPQDAGDEHGFGPSPQCHEPQALLDEGIPSPGRESSGFSHGVGAPVQPDPIPAPGPERGHVRGGSGGRSRPDIGLDAQPANPDLRGLSGCTCISQPLNSVECEFFDYTTIRLPAAAVACASPRLVVYTAAVRK